MFITRVQGNLQIATKIYIYIIGIDINRKKQHINILTLEKLESLVFLPPKKLVTQLFNVSANQVNHFSSSQNKIDKVDGNQHIGIVFQVVVDSSRLLPVYSNVICLDHEIFTAYQ